MRRSGIAVMARLVGLVRPLAGYMVLAIAMGLVGHLCATALTVLGAYGILSVMDEASLPLAGIAGAMALCALARGALRYGEQACNHFIAFKLLALIRDRVFWALRRLAPAKLEGRGKGELISVITSDIELLEVFYAHTISPALIALAFCAILIGFIGSFNVAFGIYAAFAYATVGIVLPWLASRVSGDDGLRFRTRSGELSGFVLDSLCGLDEIQQYDRGAERLEELSGRTDKLAADEERLKRVAGRNAAASGAVVLILDMGMLLLSAWVCNGQAFASILVPTVTLMGSFGPTIALANLGSTLQGTFAAGNRVLDILDESPRVTDVTGHEPVSFSGAAARRPSSAESKTGLARHLARGSRKGRSWASPAGAEAESPRCSSSSCAFGYRIRAASRSRAGACPISTPQTCAPSKRSSPKTPTSSGALSSRTC